MAQHLVDNNFNAAPMRLGNQFIKIGQRAEDRIYIAVITDVVTKIFHRRFKKGRYPNRIHTEARDVIELADNTGDITYAVIVGVHHAAWIYLIYHRTAPPGSCCHLRESLVIDLTNTNTAVFELGNNNIREQYFFAKSLHTYASRPAAFCRCKNHR